MNLEPNATGHRPAPPTAPIAGDAVPCAVTPGYPSHLVEAVRLRDGTPLTVRPICADDYRLELEFVRGLSARSAYQRLLSPRKLRAAELQRLVRIDYGRELALIATAVVDGQVRQIGVARYAPEPDGASCDFGIVVADAWQGRGLGEVLLRALVRAAALAGVPELSGLTLAANHAMRELARKIGFSVHRDPLDATVVQLRLPLPQRPRADARRPAAGTDARWPRSTTRLDSMLNGLVVVAAMALWLLSMHWTAVPPTAAAVDAPAATLVGA